MIADKKLEAVNYRIKTGGIEAVSNSQIAGGKQYFGSITFEDGEVIRNVVVGNQLAPYVDPGVSGRFAIANVDHEAFILATELPGGKLRTCNEFELKYRGWGSAIGVFLIAFVFFAAPAASIWLPSLLIVFALPALMIYRAVTASGKHKTMRKLVRQMTDTQQLVLPSAIPAGVSEQEMAAA